MTLTHQMQFANAYAKVTERYAADVAQFEHIVARQAHIKAAQATRAQSLAELGEKAAQITFEAMANASVRAEPVPADPFK
jgi:hypothetical protein